MVTNWLIAIGFLILGFIIGVIDTIVNVCVKRTFGTIKWVKDGDDDPYLFLDMDMRPEKMAKYKFVVFKTDLKDGPRE